MRIQQSLQQISNLYHELKRMNNTRWWRWLSCWFTVGFWSMATYRIERSLYLLLGNGYSVVRIILSPVIFLLSPWLGRLEIHYRANIGEGMIILHPSLGAVVNAASIIGTNLTLSGGNCIGGRKKMNPGDIKIGNNVTLGINAVVLGPVKIGNNVEISPGAVVTNDVEDNKIVVAIPPRVISMNP
jgi:serine O-acetyltransferase